LIFAAKNGHYQIVKLLADAGADLYVIQSNDRGDDYGNAFDVALVQGRGEIARLLWERSDKIQFARNLDRQFAFACARFCSPRYGATPEENIALFIATVIPNEQMLGSGIAQIPCHSGDALERLRFLLSAGVRFPKNTLLGCASMPEPQATQSLAVAELLLAQGADPNIASAGPWSATPLMLAAGKHNPEMVRLLLNSGANPKLPSETGRTALMSAVGACYSGSASTSGRQRQRLVVELLFAAGANISARDRRGTTAAALADECCKRQVADEDQRRICRLLTGQERASPDSGVYPARASRRGPMTFSA